MHILHVLDHSIPIHSGYSFRTRSILEHQRALGWHTSHVTSIKHSGATDIETVDGLTFYRTAPARNPFARLPVLQQVAVVTTLRRRLFELVPKLRPHVLHAHSPSLTGIAALQAGRRFGIPVVYEVRALWEEGAVVFGRDRRGGLRYRAIRALENYVLSNCDGIVTICEGLRRELTSRGLPDEKVTVMANGVDLRRFHYASPPNPSLAARLGLANKVVLGFVGSFYEYEGLSLVLQALPAIVERRPDVHVLLVGGGEHDPELRRQAQACGLSDKVVFAGQIPHDEVPAYYALMDICVYPRLPSRAVDLVTPLKPLEAMAHGKIVIASDVGGHKELIRHKETGVLFAAGDQAALADAVLNVIQDPERCASLRRAARKYVETERSWGQLILAYKRAYGGAMAARRCHPFGLPARDPE